MVERWKGKGRRKVEESVNIYKKKKKKVNVKKNYNKIGKKEDNDVNPDVT